MTRPPRLWKWLIAAAVALLGVLAIAALGFVAAFSGGLDDLLDGSQPTPSDERVVAERAEAGEAAGATAVAVASEARARFGGTSGPKEAAAGECLVGFHDWKRDDPYDLLCFDDANVTVSGATVTAEGAALLDAALAADGWSPGLSLARVTTDYPFSDDPPAADYYRAAERLSIDPDHIATSGDIRVTVTVETAVG